MSIYKENLESQISDRISQLQITKESKGFSDLSERKQTEIAMEHYVFKDVLSQIQNFRDESMILVPRNSDLIGVLHLLNTTDKYLNYAYNLTLDQYQYLRQKKLNK